MKRLIATLLAGAAALLLASGAAAETFVRMVSGPSGGSWYPLGAKIMEVLDREIDEISASNGPGGGVGNVKDVGKREAEIGWSYGHTAYNGLNGRGKFKKAMGNVRYFATLYPAALQTVVPKDSAVKGYADLADKNLSPGKAQWSGYAAAEVLVKQYGYDFKQVRANGGTVHHVSYSDSVALMKDGHIDAFVALTSVPQASLIDLNFNPGVRFLGVEKEVIDKVLAENPGYISTEIPTSAYDGLSENVLTLGAVTVLVVRADVADDIVYKMAKALWDNHAEIAKVKPAAWSKVSLDNALLGAAIPVHPGAMRYYEEQGVKIK